MMAADAIDACVAMLQSHGGPDDAKNNAIDLLAIVSHHKDR